MKGYLKNVKGNEYTFLVNADVDLNKLSRKFKGNIQADIEFKDNRRSTEQQRKFAFGLMGSIADYTGYPPDYAKSLMYIYHENLHGLEGFSLSPKKCSIDGANSFLETVIEFCFQYEIPFDGKELQLDQATSKMLYAFTMNRKCWICGKHADIHHWEALGMGRDREAHDHTGHRFVALCREHHNEVHNIGRDTFADKYHVKPIKLNSDDLKELGVMR